MLVEMLIVKKHLLKKHKLSFTQLLDDDKLKTILFHSESGESLESSVIMPIIDLKGMNKYQSTGSAITYFRRYSLACILGLITDKDLDACGDVDSEKTLNSCKDLDELKGVYSKLSKADQAKYASLKDELKLKLK